jgi:hypothetical protein
VICHVPEPLSISDVVFVPASPGEIADGFLGWVTCLIDDTLRLAPMRVRVLHDGIMWIKVRRGGMDLYAGSTCIDDEQREEIHGLILAAPAFQAGLAAIGFGTGGHA